MIKKKYELIIDKVMNHTYEAALNNTTYITYENMKIENQYY